MVEKGLSLLRDHYASIFQHVGGRHFENWH